MRHLKSLILTACLWGSSALHADAQAMFFDTAQVNPDTVAVPAEEPPLSVSDSLLNVYNYDSDDLFNLPPTLPDAFFMPAIYDTFHYITPLKVGDQVYSGEPWRAWLEDAEIIHRQVGSLYQYLFYERPDVVKYNMSMLPVAPPQYQVVVDPSDFSISVVENVIEPDKPTVEPEEFKKRHWIRAFSTNLQFSQAYVSPNWYQGGNNALNVLGHIVYNVKLNTAFHPNLMFENNFQYKVGLNNAPDDSIHAYNITEDLLQFNSTFGIKAANRWYYSLTGQFKTQVLHSYKSNTRDLVSSFLSPAELTAGLGMTYSYANQANTFTFNASIAPISYQLYVCLSDRLNRSAYGIAEGHKTASKFGSTAEIVMGWKISHNIAYNTRIFAFTDYESFRADWENTLAFEINRFLTTQIYAHLRYDTRTPYVDDHGKWKKLQLKEIFSIGFAYKFSTI